MHMSSFVVNFPLSKKKLNPGISQETGQFCPIIPGHGKASKILNPIVAKPYGQKTFALVAKPYSSIKACNSYTQRIRFRNSLN